jgi:hypothetical protein
MLKNDAPEYINAFLSAAMGEYQLWLCYAGPASQIFKTGGKQ